MKKSSDRKCEETCMCVVIGGQRKHHLMESSLVTLDKIDMLETVVYSTDAVMVQLAMNQKRQKTDASFAVSFVVRGSNSSHRLTFSEKTDGARKFVRIVAVGASRGSTEAIA